MSCFETAKIVANDVCVCVCVLCAVTGEGNELSWSNLIEFTTCNCFCCETENVSEYIFGGGIDRDRGRAQEIPFSGRNGMVRAAENIYMCEM